MHPQMGIFLLINDQLAAYTHSLSHLMYTIVVFVNFCLAFHLL